MTKEPSFPTILVAEHDDGVPGWLVRSLQHEGYFVLVAQRGPEAIEIARVHSRPIHLMLTDDSIDSRTLAATVKQYRSDMRVLFIARCAREDDPDLLTSDTALARVRELLDIPRNSATELAQDRQPLRQAKLSRASHA